MEGYMIYFYDKKEKHYFFYCIDKLMRLSDLVSIYKNSEFTGYISNINGEILSRF